MKDVAEGMAQSLEQREPYYREIFLKEIVRQNKTTFLNPVTAKIIVIIGLKNFSAALNFIDELKAMQEDVILIGKITGSDRLYMEARIIELPSRLGTFTFPIKVYRNRLRGDNMPYQPDSEHETKDTDELKKSILKTFDGKA